MEIKVGDKVTLIECPDNLSGAMYRVANIISDTLIVETPYGPRFELKSNCILVKRAPPTNLKATKGFKYV